MADLGSWEPMAVPEAPVVETTTFQVERLAVSHILSVEAVRQDADAVFGTMRYTLYGYAGRRMLERVEVRWPSDWWEAVKERWAPAWVLSRWPVRYERRRLEAAEWLHRQWLEGNSSRVAVEVFRYKGGSDE